MRSYLIGLVILLLILPDLVSAEMVTLQNCIIDTGAYPLPVDSLGTGKYRTITPLEPYSNESLSEGIHWRFTDNEVYGTGVIVLYDSEKIHLPILLSGTMKMVTGKNITPEIVTKPYPGWVASCRVGNTTTIFTEYCGAVSPTISIVFYTDESPNMAAYILQNLKVIPKAKEEAALTQSVASSLK